MNTYGKKSTLCKIHYLIEKTGIYDEDNYIQIHSFDFIHTIDSLIENLKQEENAPQILLGSEIFLTYDERKTVINNIYSKLIENNYKVLNINFEKINDINSFYRFIIELTPRLREAGIKTVVTYNAVMNEEKVLKIVDYLVKDE